MSVAGTLWYEGADRGGMSEAAGFERSRRSNAEARQTANGEAANQVEASPTELLELLDAEYTQEILEAVSREARSARELAELCGASRPTVYRRLNSLQAAGLVETEVEYDADGHHRTVFETTLEAVSVDVTDDGLSVTVTTATTDEPTTRAEQRRSRH
ncbi:MAG: putative transcriptional regulator [Natronomonas sp.]|jgi:predicted transcriptional regulator